MIATRNKSTDEFKVYVADSTGTYTEELSVIDSGGTSKPISTNSGLAKFGFFFDDTTGGEATESGEGYSIKIWDGALIPEEVSQSLVKNKDFDETNETLSSSGALEVTDLDATDIVNTSLTLSVSGTSDRNDPAAPSMLSSSPCSASLPIQSSTPPSNQTPLSWSFNSGTEAFDYLEDGETLHVLTYTVTATDDDSTPLGSSETVTITITGTNDAPVITNGADAASLTETDTTLATNGSFDVTDADTKDLVSATVSSVALSGTTSTSGSTLPAALRTTATAH